MISAVIFDVANVIADWDPMRAFEGVVSAEEAARLFESEAFWEVNAQTDAGLLLTDGLVELDEIAPELTDLYRLYLKNFPATTSGPVPGTADVIDALLSREVPVYGLSNWSAENFNVARRAAPAIDRLADVIVSGEVGMAKPDPAIFRYALHRFGLVAGDTLMVDDTAENLHAAASVGLQTVLFTSAAALRADLERLGLL
ncbi:MAG: HAD family phosphatase [Micropruina sp.]|nr:MAG: HAD family phosphatase [Micropruina sp.]